MSLDGNPELTDHEITGFRPPPSWSDRGESVQRVRALASHWSESKHAAVFLPGRGAFVPTHCASELRLVSLRVEDDALEGTRTPGIARILAGVVAIVFATMGVLAAVVEITTWNDGAEYVMLSHVGAYGYWLALALTLRFFLFGIHVGAGVALLRASHSASRWLLIYGVAAIVVAGLDAFLSIRLVPSEAPEVIQANALGRAGAAVFGCPWPIACIVLSKLAFVRAPASVRDSGEAPPIEPQDDFEALKLHPAMRSAGASCLVTGLVSILLGAQTFGVVGSWNAISMGSVVLMAALGFLWASLGVLQLRMRGWASRNALISCGIGFVLAVTWMVFSVLHGLFSLFALALIPLTLAAAWLAWRAQVPGRRADEARHRLDEQGLSTGI